MIYHIATTTNEREKTNDQTTNNDQERQHPLPQLLQESTAGLRSSKPAVIRKPSQFKATAQRDWPPIRKQHSAYA